MDNWWVCQMHGGGWFWVRMGVRPDVTKPIVDLGVSGSMPITIAANSFRVIYGPCSQQEAEQYMQDVEARL